MKIYTRKGQRFQRVGKCKQCGECCRNLGLEIETSVEPNGKSKHVLAKEIKQKEVEKYTKKGYKNVEASRITWTDETDIKFTLTLDCPHLKNNKCVIHSNGGYNKKPDFCQRFPEPHVLKPKECAYRFKKLN